MEAPCTCCDGLKSWFIKKKKTKLKVMTNILLPKQNIMLLSVKNTIAQCMPATTNGTP